MQCNLEFFTVLVYSKYINKSGLVELQELQLNSS